jgi:hypothetical protein
MNCNIIKTYADQRAPYSTRFSLFLPPLCPPIMGIFYKKLMQVCKKLGKPGGKGLYPTLIKSHHQSQIGNQSFHKCRYFLDCWSLGIGPIFLLCICTCRGVQSVAQGSLCGGIPHMRGAPWCEVRHKVWDQFDHHLRRTLQPYLVYEMKLTFSTEPSFK